MTGAAASSAASPPDRRRRHLSVATFARALLIAGAVVLWQAAPAAAACAPTDLECLQGTVGGALEDPTGTVEDTAETVTGQVDETAGTVQDTLDDTVRQVRELLDPPGDDDPPEDEDEPPGGGGSGEGGKGGGAGSIPGPGRPTRAAPADPPSRFAAVAVTDTSSISGVRELQAEGSIGQAILEAAGRLAFPIVLVLAVIAFLTIQDRLDRGDPKLALAPRTPDLVSFG